MTVRKGIELCVMPAMYFGRLDFIGSELAADSV